MRKRRLPVRPASLGYAAGGPTYLAGRPPSTTFSPTWTWEPEAGPLPAAADPTAALTRVGPRQRRPTACLNARVWLVRCVHSTVPMWPCPVQGLLTGRPLALISPPARCAAAAASSAPRLAAQLADAGRTLPGMPDAGRGNTYWGLRSASGRPLPLPTCAFGPFLNFVGNFRGFPVGSCWYQSHCKLDSSAARPS